MPPHPTRKRPRTGEVRERDRRTSQHTFLSKLDISDTPDQRHVSFTGITRRQQRRLDRKQKRKRKNNSVRGQHNDTVREQLPNHAGSAQLSHTPAAGNTDEDPMDEVDSRKSRKRDRADSAENPGTPKERIKKSPNNNGGILKRKPQMDSSPPPTDDPDAREIRRLERLLGMRGRKTSAKSSEPYAGLFDETETDLLDLMKSCDDTIKRSSTSTRNVNGNNELSTEDPATDEDSSEEGDLSAQSSDQSLPAANDDIESESKRSQGGDPDASGNESVENTPYVAKWKKKRTRSSRGGSPVNELQGLLNRVSTENAAGIATRISQLYSTKSLSKEEREKLLSSHVGFVLEAISQGNTVGTTNPYTRAHVRVLHTVGTTADIRVLARFTVATVKELSILLESEKDFTLLENTARMSRIFGYLVAICAAYEVGVLSSGFICEVFSWIAGPLSKTRVDAELKFVQEVGPLLRKRDPAVFADLVKFVQRRTKHDGSNHDSVAFPDELSCKLKMLSDTVENIKNNRMKIAKDMAQNTEESSCFLPFQASLAQLLEDEFTKRNWWDSAQQSAPTSKHTAGKDGETNGNPEGDNPRISRLAGALRLHTDGRRSLLAAVVGSVNSSDALHRIERLGALTSRQKQKDLTYILTQCCGAEQPYNNFYALLAHRVCKKSREARFALDYTIQDAIKGGTCYESGDNLTRKGANIARYLGDLWASEGLPLAMLRRIPDLEDAEEGERNFYTAALQRMISQRLVTRTDPVAPFTKLKRESEAEDKLFCTSLSVFLMRHVQGKMPKQLQPALLKIISELETADEMRDVSD